MPKVFRPEDAARLIKSRRNIEMATDIVANSVGTSRDARTRGADGLRFVDLYRRSDHETLQEDLAELLSLPLDEFKKRIPHVRISEVAKHERIEDPLAQFILGELTFSKKKRVIAVTTPWGDCIMRAFDQVLRRCSEPLLADAARAYRTIPDPVAQILREASRYITGLRESGKITYFVVADISNFFPSMSHEWTESSLTEMGFSTWVVERVMALVRSPTHGSKEIPTRGCPAGIRLSATVANIYLRDLDLELARRFPRVRHWRYSDDNLLLCEDRHELTRALAFLRGWLRERGHEVKGVAMRTPSKMLVRKLSGRTRLDVLGARITEKGSIVMQPEKKGGFKRKLGDHLKLLKTQGPVIGGISMYAKTKGQRPHGRYVFDYEDITSMLTQVEEYWGLLNGPMTQDFLAEIRREFGADLSLVEGLSRKWVAWIPGSPQHPLGGADRPQQMSAVQLQDTLSHLIQSIPQEPLRDLGDLGGDAVDTPSGDSSTRPPGHGTPMHIGRKPLGAGESRGDGERSGTHSSHTDVEDSSSVCCGNAGSHRLANRPEDGGSGDNPSTENTSFAEVAGGAAGSRPPVHPTMTVIVADKRRQHVPGKTRHMTTVAVETASGVRELTFPLPERAALLRAILEQLRAVRAPTSGVVVLRGPAWLPKHLLKSSNRFHSVVSFDLVEALHSCVRTASFDLVLVGDLSLKRSADKVA